MSNNSKDNKVEAEDITNYTKEELTRKNNNSSSSNDNSDKDYANINQIINNIGSNSGLAGNKDENINLISSNSENVVDSKANTNIVQEKKYYNPEYFDEFGRPKIEQSVEYENMLRAEMESMSPLVSDKFEIMYLTFEFKDSQFENSVKDVVNKYKFIRTVRRDGNCFYRSFLFRLFEELSMNKNSQLYNQMVKVVEDSKSLCVKNGYQWLVLEDFYNMFISEWKFIYDLDPLNSAEYMYIFN
jgi:hypothetical protein